MRAGWTSWGACLALAFVAGCGTDQAAVEPAAVKAPVKVGRCLLKYPHVHAGRVARARLGKDLARYVSGRPGHVAYAALDLVSGVRLAQGEHERDVIIAGGAKVDIVTALLQRRTGALGKEELDLAARMIKKSEDKAADALWSRIGAGGAMSEFYRQVGLKETTPGPGDHWGGTRTSPADRVRLLKVLIKGGRGLSVHDRRLVLRLMSQVVRDQAWGVSAAARPVDRVALKNGWTRRPFESGTWAVTSYGRVAGPGRDLLLSVQTDGQPEEGTGRATIEGIARMIGARLDSLSPTVVRLCPTHAFA
ncbi:serine hydrolase [Nonomuraea jiangxiensis]|uniref:Beta-lactamase enzyme family protein n=1 Tax=Nonomuraea jiangxiensis TaxID=633440 RepID=A0A1G9SDR1_9ACTN|nr:serine hydrolase [Nonomuraea jiangxiensis]SDM33614.1 Beta-lactamase enzyme family protein [Nonomuraea jiangxiensis]